MWDLILTFGLIGFIAGVIGIVAMLSQRDANRQKAKPGKSSENGPPPPS